MMNRFFTLLLAASCLTAVGQVPDYVPADGLVAWWGLNGNGNDESQHGNHALNFGAVPSIDRFGNEGGSLLFQGQERLEVPHSGSLSIPFGEALSWSVWLYMENESVPQDAFAKWNGSSSSPYSQIMLRADGVFPNQHLYTQAWCPPIQTSHGRCNAVDSLGWVGKWVHVLMRSQAGISELFVDGQSVYTSEQSMESGCTNSSPLTIGARSLNTQRFFFGRMDDFGIWSAFLTDEEVTSLFSAPSPEVGCTQPDACNYNADALLDDGTCASCEALATACLSGTEWSEELGGCIVANPADINLDGCVQLNDLLDLLSAYGDCGAEETPWQCGDPLEYQGYNYETVQIGEQCWFAENLRSENYENGDAIPSNLSDDEWLLTTLGAMAVYGEEPAGCNSDLSPVIDACDPIQSLEEFGRLYNWYAVDDARGLCPSGWHVPTDGEWMTLEMALGMSEAQANGLAWRGTNQGTQMKTTYGWNGSGYGSGTDSSGFSALPGGFRHDTGYVNGAGLNGYWWTSSPPVSNTWFRLLSSFNEGVHRGSNSLRSGFSVRCIKDVE